MSYRVIRPQESWARLLWPRDQTHTPAVVQTMKELTWVPGVRAQESYLELPCTTWNLPQVQELFERVGQHVPDLVPRPYGQLDKPDTLFDYQWEGVGKIMGVAGFLLSFDLGLGKTRTALISAWLTRALSNRPVLIVSTLSSRNVWRKELKALGIPGKFHTLATRDITYEWDPTADFYFVHFAVIDAWITKLHALKPCVAIVDEAHWIKNGRTKRGKGTYSAVAPIPRRILLTGTPIENTPSDLWHLLTITTGPYTWGGPNDFRKRYCGSVSTGYGGLKDGNPTHVQELQQRMAPFYLRRTAQEVGLNLPALRRQLEVVELSQSLAREHEAVLGRQSVQELVSAIMAGAVKDRVLETLTRLRQITSQGKKAATLEYVLNAQEQGEGVVVFTWEQATARDLAEQIPGSFLVTGDVPQAAREKIIDLFQQTPGSVLVATLGALRESVTLHTARIVVLHDWHWALTHLLQAEGRIWRTGQRRACQSVWMMAEDSVDMILARVLYAKAKSMAVVSGDKGLEALEELGIAQMVVERDQHRVQEMLSGWL